MTTLREAAQQALDALMKSHTCPLLPDDCESAITALKAALAQEQAEPVAKVIATAPTRIWLDLGFDPADEDITFEQLFEATWSQDNATGWGIEYVRADLAAPPQRKPLTEEEMRGLADDYLSYQDEGYEASGVFALIRAVERAHGIGKGASC